MKKLSKHEMEVFTGSSANCFLVGMMIPLGLFNPRPNQLFWNQVEDCWNS